MKIKSLFLLLIVYLTLSSNFINCALLRSPVHQNISKKIDNSKEETIFSFENAKVFVRKGNDSYDLDAKLNITKNGISITKSGSEGAPINEVFSLACNNISETSVECDFKGKCDSISKLEGQNLVIENKFNMIDAPETDKNSILNVSLSVSISDLSPQLVNKITENIQLKNGESVNKKFDYYYSKLCKEKVEKVEKSKRVFISNSTEYTKLKHKLTDIDKNIKTLSNTIKDVSIEAKKSNNVIIDTNNNTKNIEFQITNLNKLISANTNTISSSQKQIDQLNKESLKLKEILDLAKTAINKEKDNFNIHNKNQKSLLNQQAEIDHLKETVTLKLAELKKQMKSYEKEKLNIINTENTKTAEIDSTYKSINLINNEEIKIKESHAKISKELDNSNKSILDMKKSEEDLKKEVQYLNETIDGLIQKKKNIEVEITNLSNNDLIKGEEIKKEQIQITKLEEILTLKEKEKQELIAKSEKIKKEKEDLKQIEVKYGNEQNDLDTKYKEYEAKLLKYENESKQNKSKTEEVKSLISLLKADIEESEKKIVGLQNDISTSFQTSDRLSRNIKTLSDTNKRLSSHQASFRALMQDVNNSLSVNEDHKSLVQYRINTYSSKLENLNKTKNELISDITTLRTSVNNSIIEFRKEAGASSQILVDLAERSLFSNPTSQKWKAIANRIGS